VNKYVCDRVVLQETVDKDLAWSLDSFASISVESERVDVQLYFQVLERLGVFNYTAKELHCAPV